MDSYLIESIDSLSLKKERDNLIKENDFLDAEISTYDLEEVELDNALENLDTYGFLSSKKVIVIQNIESIKYDDYKKDIDHLFKYIDNPNSDNLLIIEARKLNNTLKITKELKKKCKYILVEFNSKDYIKTTLKDYKIDNLVINLLDEYCQSDITKIDGECSKLMNYKSDTKTITKEDIEEMVVKKLGDERDLTFAFSRSLAERNIKEALLKYHELLNYNIEPLSIIGLLASQIRIIYQVKLLEKNRLSDREIADTLGEKSDYRIKKTRELTRLYSEDELKKKKKKLSDMDYKIKTTDVDGKNLIEMFIINI